MSDLAFHVRSFVPDCADGEELDARSALLKARDFAAAQRCKVVSDQAIQYACDAHELAGSYVFAPASVDRLKVAVRMCRQLVQLAYQCELLSDDVRS